MVYDTEPLNSRCGGGGKGVLLEIHQSQVWTRPRASLSEREEKVGKGGFEERSPGNRRWRTTSCPSPFILPQLVSLPHAVASPAPQASELKSEAHLSFISPFFLPPSYQQSPFEFDLFLSNLCPQLQFPVLTFLVSASAKLLSYLKCLHFHLMSLYSVFLYPPFHLYPVKCHLLWEDFMPSPALCTEHKRSHHTAL